MADKPDIDMAAAATLLGVAYQMEGKNANKHTVGRRVGTLIRQTRAVADILQAASWTVDDTKFPQTVVGILSHIDGNCLHYNDPDGEQKDRRVFAGFDFVSLAALNAAAKILESNDRRAIISFGWVHGINGEKQATNMRRLYDVFAWPQAGGQQRPAQQQQPAQQRPQEGSESVQRPPQQQRREEAPKADLAPLWAAVWGIVEETAKELDAGPTEDDLRALHALLAAIPQRDRVAVAKVMADADPAITNIKQPYDMSEYHAIIAGIDAATSAQDR